MPILSVRSGPKQGTEFRIQKPVVVIGRGSTADLPLGDGSVSRHHAKIACENDEWGIQDLESANGTFVNGRRISHRVPLASGDSVRLGSVLMSFTDGAASNPDAAGRPGTGSSTLSAPAPPPARGPAGTPSPAEEAEPQSRILLRVAPELTNQTGTLFSSIKRSRALDNLKKISAMVFDEKALLAFIAEELLATLPQADRALVLLWDTELSRFVPSATRTRSSQRESLETSQTLLEEVMRVKEAVLISNVLGDRKFANSESMLALKVTSAICAPIMFQDDIFGVVQVDSTSVARPFTRADVAVSLALSLEVGMALAYARVHSKLVEREILEHDLDLAKKIQRHFLPAQPPDVANFTFAVEYTPALKVGGDLYEFVELADGLLAVAVGDVSGKGVSAALFAAKVMSDIRYQAKGQTSAAAILNRLNRALSLRNDEGMFVTLALIVIDLAKGHLMVASAGHPLPIVRDVNGGVSEIGKTGDKPLGLDESAEFTQHDYEIDPGDRVVLYTDGVIEALNRADELYGDSRLLEAVRRPAANAEATVQSITADVRAFADGRTQSDDITVVCFERRNHET
ncbi:MAG TPA: SpoIIE family protein phosphatase [Vicinamibacterales bacterium]|nr:SpoIIE family protein phosphatase [Vicinamibacterales bacterium]